MARKHISDKQVVIAATKFHNAEWYGGIGKYGTEILAEMTGQPLKVCEAAFIRACGRGLIDYGVSLRTAWPTDKGIDLLHAKVGQ